MCKNLELACLAVLWEVWLSLISGLSGDTPVPVSDGCPVTLSCPASLVLLRALNLGRLAPGSWLTSEGNLNPPHPPQPPCLFRCGPGAL